MTETGYNVHVFLKSMKCKVSACLKLKGGGGRSQTVQFRRTKQNIIVVLKELIPLNFVRSLRTGQTDQCSHKKDSTINLRYYNSDLIARLQITCTAVISFG